MKQHLWMRSILCLLLALFCCTPVLAFADDAGVLNEGELNTWIVQVLQRSKEEQPQNAPISEESLTEDGYAFMYSFATLYYNKPVLDSQSILTGFTITDESFETPRGIHLGTPATVLLETYGWQNPMMLGDGSFAAFYLLNQMPQNAYWSWVQHEGDAINSVQCAIHVRAGEGQYTDAGIRYLVTNGEVSSIYVYGLSKIISQADVESNLAAVSAVQAAGSGDEVEPVQPVAEGNYVQSDAPEFGPSDLQFANIDFTTLTEAVADATFGQPTEEDWVQDDTGEWLHTTQRDGLTLTHALDANRQNNRLEMLSTTRGDIPGPRGLKIGDSLSSVMALFRSDGTGETSTNEAILYGDGINAPYGALEIAPNTAILRYATSVTAADGSSNEVVLYLTFIANTLTEMMIYSW